MAELQSRFWSPKSIGSWVLETILILLLATLALGLWIIRGIVANWLWKKRLRRATAAFPKQLPKLEKQFFEIASSCDKPRGLVWKSCKFDETGLVVRDRATGDIYALIGATIAFDAVGGGEMEHVEAVSNLRCASALLEWRDRRWTTAGRVIFNLEPREVVERYRQNLEPQTEVPSNET